MLRSPGWGTVFETSFLPTSKCRLKQNLFGLPHSQAQENKFSSDKNTATYAIQVVLFSKRPYSAKEGQAVGLFIGLLLCYMLAQYCMGIMPFRKTFSMGKKVFFCLVHQSVGKKSSPDSCSQQTIHSSLSKHHRNNL